MVEDNNEDEWFKMQVWLLQYLIYHFKESDSDIIDTHDPEVFKLSWFRMMVGIQKTS